MVNKVISGRAVKMLSRFPAFMRVERSGKVVSEIVSSLGKEADETERLLTGILRSRRIAVANEERDVLQLAALLGLEPADFLILRKFYDNQFFHLRVEESLLPQEREKQIYDKYLVELKKSISRTIKIIMEGCGTLWALLEGSSILIGADTLADGHGRMEHPDADMPRGGFIHRIRIKYNTVDKTGERLEPVSKEGFIYLVENPLTEKSSGDKERVQRDVFRISRRGFFEVSAMVQVTGVAERTVFPMIINKTCKHGVGYRGVLKDGEKLLFSKDGKAYLDGVDVTGRCYYFDSGLFDEAARDSAGPGDMFCLAHPPGTLDRNYPRPLVTPLDRLSMPTVPLGDSDWRFSVQEGNFDASGFDEAVFTLPDNPVAPSGRVQIKWEENEPFAVTVLLPADLKSVEENILDEGDNLRSLVRAGLEKFRPAGVRLNVEYFDENWFLDNSLLRIADAREGDGVFFNGTIL